MSTGPRRRDAVAMTVMADVSSDYLQRLPGDGSLPCQLIGGDLWFSDRPAELELAKAHCRECPARRPCLAGAVKRGEPCGVWGGEIFDRGVIIAFKRPPGRPRKHPAGTRAA